MKLYSIIFIFSLCVHAQDESLYKKLFSKKIKDSRVKLEKSKVLVSKQYHFDLNQDGIDEVIETIKADGVDYFELKDQLGTSLFQMKLGAVGDRSSLFKVQVKSINASTKLLLLFFNQGEIITENYLKTARLYFLTIENNDFKNIYTYRGPSIFIEKDPAFGGYNLRRYRVSTYDYNKDGTTDVSVSYKNTDRLFFYKGKGNWTQL